MNWTALADTPVRIPIQFTVPCEQLHPPGRRLGPPLARSRAVARPGKLRWRLSPSAGPRSGRSARTAPWPGPRGSVPQPQLHKSLLARERCPSPLFCLAQLACIGTRLRCILHEYAGLPIVLAPRSLRHDKSDNGMWLPHLLACRPGSLTACANPAALARARGIALSSCTSTSRRRACVARACALARRFMQQWSIGSYTSVYYM